MSASPGSHPLARDEAVALGDADREADEVELARFHRAGMLGHLAADERAARPPGSPATTPATSCLMWSGVELADRDVVEEEQRLGALAHEVVDAHRDEVDADGLEPPDRLRDECLRADAIGRRHEHRIGEPMLREGEQPAEAADVADDLGTVRRPHHRLDAPRPPLRRRRCRRLRLCTSRASVNRSGVAARA